MKFKTAIIATTLATQTNKSTLKPLLLATILLFPAFAFSQGGKDNTSTDNNRSEVKYKQRHSSLIANAGDKKELYADGIKIKRDLSILEEIQAERILSEDEIPAEDLYGGMWSNQYVHVYGSLENRPDTFKIDLDNFTMPISQGHVTSNFGKRGRRMHNGIDLKVQVGDTIYAAFDGKVRVKRFERRGYGNYVAIRHPNGLETVYGHLSKFLVEENDVVRSGDPIALGGNTGRSTGSHLHLEFRFLGQAINPKEIVDFENFVCHRDHYTITPKTFVPAKVDNKYTAKSLKYHRVKKGETLYSIARKYGTTIAALEKANSMKSNKVLKVGTSLRI